MPRYKPEGSGRKKGTRNKQSQDLADMAKKLGVEPFEIMLLFAKGDYKALGYDKEMYITSSGPKGETYKYHIEPDSRLEAASQCSKYLYPQLKSVEIKDVTPKSDGPMIVKVQWDDESRNDSEDASSDASSEEIP